MNNKDENNLTIVGIEIPDGLNSQGTKVKLSDGSYLRGIKSIKLEASADNPAWTVTLEMNPNFNNQDTIQAVLKEIKVSGDETPKTTDQATNYHTKTTEA